MYSHIQISNLRSDENNDSDVQSEYEEVNVEIYPIYDLNYPRMTKWKKDHSQSQVFGDSYSGVLTRS